MDRELADARAVLELQARLDQVERELDSERRRAIRLEVERDVLTARQLPHAA